MRVLVRVTLAAFVAALCLVPSVAAQWNTPIVIVKTGLEQMAGDDRLRPETETWLGVVAAQITVPPASLCIGPVEVLFRAIVVPPYATLVIEQPAQSITILPSTGATSYHVETPIQLRTNRGAPAYADGLYQFAVEVVPPSYQEGCFLSRAEGSAQATVKNDYVPGINVGDPVVTHEGLSGWIDVPVENLANGPTRIRVQLDPAADGFVLLSAQDLLLASKVTDGNSDATTGTVRISYVLDDVESAPVKVRFVAGHDLFQSEFTESRVVYQAVGTLPPPQESGEAASFDDAAPAASTVPGPSIPLLMLVGAALLAIVRRRSH